MSTNLPAHKLPDFTEYFEKRIKELQDQQDRMFKYRNLYILTTTVIAETKTALDVNVSLDGSYCSATFTVTPFTGSHEIESIVEALGHELLSRGLHADGKPARNNQGSFLPTLSYSFRLETKELILRPEICLIFHIPEEGCADLEVKTKKHIYESQRYTVNPRSSLQIVPKSQF